MYKFLCSSTQTQAVLIQFNTSISIKKLFNTKLTHNLLLSTLSIYLTNNHKSKACDSFNYEITIECCASGECGRRRDYDVSDSRGVETGSRFQLSGCLCATVWVGKRFSKSTWVGECSGASDYRIELAGTC